ncbi:MAG: hypothetical protein ACJ75B_02850 [Flavisolibacter sp.]
MEKYYPVAFTVLYLLLSCNNGAPKAKGYEASNKIVDSTTYHNDLNRDSTLHETEYDYEYKFSNDSISQILFVKKITSSKEYPEKLKFKLILQDKFGIRPKKVFEGIARLTSSEESFSDKNDPNGGDYDAADYIFKIANCGTLQITMDIVKYDACFVILDCKSQDYNFYFSKDPSDYNVMKRI